MKGTDCQYILGAVLPDLGEVGYAHLARLGMEEADAHHRCGDAVSVPSPIFPASRRHGEGPAAGRIDAGSPLSRANLHGARSRRQGWPRRRPRAMLGA
jgi:hypothetical protein